MQSENISSASEQNEKNKLEAMDLADKIYKIVLDPRFIEQVPDPNIRHKVLMEKYPNFAQAYPVVLRWLARDLKYHRNAFKQFLDKMEKDPGKGMQGFMERQADYAKFLYIAWHKGKHPNMKAANELWRMEYENMSKWHKKLLEEEKSARNEFEEEEAENLEQKRKELLDLVNMLDDDAPSFEALDIFHEDAERMKHGLPLKNPNPSFDDLDVEKLSKEELCLILREVKSHENDLIAEIKKRDELMIKMKNELIELRKFKEQQMIPKKPKVSRKKEVTWDSEWIAGTSAENKKGKRSKTRK